MRALSSASARRERLEDLVAVLGPLHVDEVDDDDAAQVAQPDLAHDLAGRLEVDLEHRLLEVALAHVLAGVDVDGHQGLGVVDDDVAAGLEPDPPPERLLDLLLDAGGLEDRLRASSQRLTRSASWGTSGSANCEALLVGGAGCRRGTRRSRARRGRAPPGR